jgi:galactitol-specific phosphotransferase system IIC component
MVKDLSHKDKEVVKRLDYLIHAMDKAYPPVSHLIVRSFVQGVFIGLGTTVGLSIILSIIAFILKMVGKEVKL